MENIWNWIKEFVGKHYEAFMIICIGVPTIILTQIACGCILSHYNMKAVMESPHYGVEDIYLITVENEGERYLEIYDGHYYFPWSMVLWQEDSVQIYPLRHHLDVEPIAVTLIDGTVVNVVADAAYTIDYAEILKTVNRPGLDVHREIVRPKIVKMVEGVMNGCDSVEVAGKRSDLIDEMNDCIREIRIDGIEIKAVMVGVLYNGKENEKNID